MTPISQADHLDPIRTGLRAIRRWWLRRVASVDHVEVIACVDADGSLRGNYMFMCAMAAGIAMIGLLLNSPAVIIGAMLVSPLMGPIVRLGLGITTLDHRRAASAGLALLAGMGIALAMSILIVWLSPVRELTAEILARTRPSLFDLLVATLSGLAGGYAMVRGKGGTIVGVAIATALMPPMAVVGFGIAAGHADVAQGALLLFVTNLVAIALSVTAVTTWYGFSRRAWRAALAWQTLLGAVLVAPLLVPLIGALHTITLEAGLQSTVRESIRTAMADRTYRILSLQIGSKGTATRSVELTMALQRYDEALAATLRDSIARAVPGELALRLTPIVMAEPQRILVAESAIANPVQPPPAAPAPTLISDPAREALERFPLRVQASNIDRALKTLRIEVDPANRAPLALLRSMEATMQQGLSGWKVEIAPPRATPLRVHFVVNSSQIDPARDEDYADVLWTLRRWGVQDVRLEGRASSDGDGPSPLAAKRAVLIAEMLERDGVAVFEAVGRYPYPNQALIEDAIGKHALRTVLVLPRSSELAEPLPSDTQIEDQVLGAAAGVPMSTGSVSEPNSVAESLAQTPETQSSEPVSREADASNPPAQNATATSGSPASDDPAHADAQRGDDAKRTEQAAPLPGEASDSSESAKDADTAPAPPDEGVEPATDDPTDEPDQAMAGNQG